MMDERYILHRFKATRLATLVGTFLMFGFFTYDIVTEKVIRWEYVIIMTAMTVTKMVSLFYFRKTN